MDRAEPRDAAGLAAMRAHAASLTCSSDKPGGPPRHFCGAVTTRQSPQAVTSQSMPPKEDTASTMSSAPCSATTAAIAARSLTLPQDVSRGPTRTTELAVL